MNLETVLRVAGATLIALAALHLTFPARFRWKEEFARVSLINRQIFGVHCFFICLILVLMGLLCLVWPGSLVEPGRLGRLVSAGLAIFWGCRLAVQWFVYDPVHWRGKRFETAAHLGFSGLWLIYTMVFAWVFFRQIA
jgi:hypothetical protein